MAEVEGAGAMGVMLVGSGAAVAVATTVATLEEQAAKKAATAVTATAA